MAPALYEDRWITCEPDRLIIRGYYFPFGRKVIAYRQIRSVTPFKLTPSSGSWRIWGATDPRYWFHLDPGRPHKQTALVLDVGSWVKPVISPDDPEQVATIIEQRRRPSSS
ncbi:MAG TPA: hypothetical protein VFD32_02350 [Dehalococcoidia bacterium]|nr:hypothetical protein [Dehalococcoidia bacterium]